MAAKKSRVESYLSVKNLRELADQMLELETKNLAKSRKKLATSRGEDLRNLIKTRFPDIGEEALKVAMWVDLYIYTRDILTDNDYYFTLMNVDEAIPALIEFENNNPDQFQSIFEWVNNFGCLLTEGRHSDIGAWFHDWFFEPLFEIEALVDGEHLYLENRTKALLTKLSKSKSVRDRVQAALMTDNDVELFEILAQDSATAVRFAVARNPTAPESILSKLSGDTEKLIREAALKDRE